MRKIKSSASEMCRNDTAISFRDSIIRNDVSAREKEANNLLIYDNKQLKYA